MNKYFLLSLLTFFIVQIESKVYRTSISIQQLKRSHGKFITKFSFRVNEESESVFRFRLVGLDVGVPYFRQFQLRFAYNRFEDYLQLKNIVDCQPQTANSFKYHSAGVVPNAWSGDYTTQFSPKVKTWAIYFSILDCMEDFTDIINGKLELEVSFKSGSSHFSANKVFIVELTLIEFILSFIFFVYGYAKYKVYKQKYEETDYPLLLLIVIVSTNLIALTLKLIHLWKYTYDGEGLIALEYIGIIVNQLSQFCFLCLLILLSWGWTITYKDLDSFDIFIPVASMVGVFKLLIVFLGNIVDEEEFKHHQYHGFVGIIIFTLRIGFYVYFIFGLLDISKKVNANIKAFIYQLAIFGTLYFLCHPIVSLISSLFVAVYCQETVISFVVGGFELGAVFYLLMMFTYKKSSYQHIALKNRSLLGFSKYD